MRATAHPSPPPATAPPFVWTPMSPGERERFARDGFLLIPGALDAHEVARHRAAVDRVHRSSPAGRTGGPLHLLSAVASCPELVGLIAHPAVFGLVWSILGWNVHLYHSHIDMHPPTSRDEPPRWRWHQDGGRQNRELEGDPRPRMSLKLAFWLSNASVTGRGNLMVVPGSHRANRLPVPPGDAARPRPAGAVEILARPGDALLLDRRLWHARSENRSAVTRRVVYLAYSYRWAVMRDDNGALEGSPSFAALSPIERQMLGFTGHGSGDHAWGHAPEKIPLYEALAARGLLDPRHPPLAPY